LSQTAHVLALLGVAAWFTLAFPSVARAHAVGAEVKLKDGRVVIEVYYDDDTPGAEASVKVTDPSDKLVAEGKTDERGLWSFPAPLPGKYKVVVDAGAGHKSTISVTIPEPAEPKTVQSEAPAAKGETPVTVSEGPSRSEFTGTMRYVWAAVGLAVIGIGTWVVTRVFGGSKRPYPRA
jgi:hypothetical protein